MKLLILIPLVSCLAIASTQAQSRAEIEAALVKAVEFYHDQVSNHGGYVYKYSSDLTLREAEGYPDMDTIWIQPPGTPAVGEAFLDAYDLTKNHACSIAALNAARALVNTQLHSGGWHYRGHLDGEKRGDFWYRRTTVGELTNDPTPLGERSGAGGWTTWRQRKFGPQNQTILDDDVTQAALRCLMRVDAALNFGDERIHEAVNYGLEALLGTQYPVGGWSGNFDRFPGDENPSQASYPIKSATIPENPPKTWPKDYAGCYVLNDNLQANNLRTLLLAWKIYQKQEYLTAAKRAGDFLLKAQLPAPQRAWAQQYDANMQPVWDRPFEPPAVASHESQQVIWAMLELIQVEKSEVLIQSVKDAHAYLKSSLLDDGTLARYYELETNRPIFFTRGPGGKGHVMTYERANLASNYGWIFESELDAIESRINEIVETAGVAKRGPDPKVVAAIIASQDDRGAWMEPAGPELWVRDSQGRKQLPEDGVIQSATFIRNVEILCAALDSM
ncbi:MAG: polysaccharide lyase [Verrucomicrobiota bacterium]